jgi:glycosyltransferase involved in cell wall biosynthesis
LRIYNLLRGLAQHHKVTLLSFADQPEVDLEADELRSLCDQVQVVPWKSFQPQSWPARLGWFRSTPRSVIDTYSPEMERCIEQILNNQEYDLVVASQLGVASYGRQFGGLPALFEEVEVGVLYERFAQAGSLPARFRHGLTWAKHRRYLTSLLRCFTACTVASDAEYRLVSEAVPNFKAVEVIPNCINLTDYRDVSQVPQPNSLIFTGSFRYFANHDAMVWFLGEVLPRLQTQLPDVGLTITGDHANLPLPTAKNVTLTGLVDDVRPLLASAWASVVPLRLGGGTRLKILEAMALRTPVVATSKGAEGLDVKSGENLLIADTPDAFAEAVLRLLQEPRLRQHLADKAYQLVAKKYDWAVTMPRFLELVERVSGHNSQQKLQHNLGETC